MTLAECTLWLLDPLFSLWLPVGRLSGGGSLEHSPEVGKGGLPVRVSSRALRGGLGGGQAGGWMDMVGAQHSEMGGGGGAQGRWAEGWRGSWSLTWSLSWISGTLHFASGPMYARSQMLHGYLLPILSQCLGCSFCIKLTCSSLPWERAFGGVKGP